MPRLGKSGLFAAGTGVVAVTSVVVPRCQTAVVLRHHAPHWTPVQQGGEDRAGSWGTSPSGCSQKILPRLAPSGAEGH